MGKEVRINMHRHITWRQCRGCDPLSLWKRHDHLFNTWEKVYHSSV